MVNVLRKVNLLLPRSSLLTVYKSFLRTHLDYGNVIYDQSNNSRLSDNIETVQYKDALAITGAIRGTSTEKLYQELGHKFRHNFADTLNPLCSCTLETEVKEHYFLCC